MSDNIDYNARAKDIEAIVGEVSRRMRAALAPTSQRERNIELAETPIPHSATFQAFANTLAKTYWTTDEAIKVAWENARFMKNDLAVMECVEMRRRSVALFVGKKVRHAAIGRSDLTLILFRKRRTSLIVADTYSDALFFKRRSLHNLIDDLIAVDRNPVVDIVSRRPVYERLSPLHLNSVLAVPKRIEKVLAELNKARGAFNDTFYRLRRVSLPLIVRIIGNDVPL